MTEADLQGSDGHGVIRLAPYIKRIKSGGINLRPNIRIVEERAATALLDGDNAMAIWSCRAPPRWLPRRPGSRA